MPALEVWGHIYEKDGLWKFEGGIRSIDDSGLTLFSNPDKTREKALYRLNQWRIFIENKNYACPIKEDIELFCHMINVHAEYW